MARPLASALFLVLLSGSVLALGGAPAAEVQPPLRQTELLALVAGQALPENIVREISTRGVAFHANDAYRSLLKNAGAAVPILTALNGAKIVIADGVEDEAAPDLLQHLSNAGKLL